MVLGTLTGGWIGKLQDRVRPNPYAPPLPDQQREAIAQAARLGGELRGGTGGLSGSEADYYADAQGIGTVGYLRIVQDVTSARLPVSTFVAGDPGADGQPLLSGTGGASDFDTGPVRPLSNAEGGQSGTVNRGTQHVIPTTLLVPGAVTPSPRQIVAARQAGAPQGDQDALASYWEG